MLLLFQLLLSDICLELTCFSHLTLFFPLDYTTVLHEMQNVHSDEE